MTAPHIITSLQNDRIKAIRALDMRKVRKETGLFVAEGASLIMSGRDAGFIPATLVYRPDAEMTGLLRGLVAWAGRSGADVLEVTEAVLGKIASKDNPQTMLAVFRQRWSEPPTPEALSVHETWIALEDVRDPGNLGTILRTAHAAGAGGICLVGNCCDPFALECVRATMGSIFSVPIVRMSRAAFLSWRSGWPGDVIATHLDGATDFRRGGWTGPTLILMGSEGPGLSAELAASASQRVKIPMAGTLDSLNLAIATALVLYEVRRPYLTFGAAHAD